MWSGVEFYAALDFWTYTTYNIFWLSIAQQFGGFAARALWRI